MTNRSAKGGARSSLHYGGEGDLIHPPHQGVCGRHGMEDQCVTLGDLGGSAGGAAATDPISESEVGRDARRGVGPGAEYVPEAAVNRARDRQGAANRVGWRKAVPGRRRVGDPMTGPVR